MSDDPAINVSQQDIEETTRLLEQMVSAAKKQVGTLAGGVQTDLAAEGVALLDKLRTVEVRFSNPNAKFFRLTPKRFEREGIELAGWVKDSLKTFDYYFLGMTANLFTGDTGVQFSSLLTRFTFSPDTTILHSLFPTSQWRTVFSVEGGFSVGVDNELNYGIEAPERSLEIPGLNASVRGALTTSGGLKGKAVIAMPDFKYEQGRSEIAVAGEGSDIAQWRVTTPELKQQQRVDYAMIFKVPKGAAAITLEGKMIAQTSMPWLTARLGDLLNALAGVFPFLTRRDAKLPLGAVETWKDLALPQD
ncbi:MAG TPA: hypothetical protein PLD47_07740 [Aggregatilineales bacterium]|nr:hypothetical protein [Anaerolineales bacterium]HRE47599.1 hypothetical protein [Aggregatilineales bacterium]